MNGAMVRLYLESIRARVSDNMKENYAEFSTTVQGCNISEISAEPCASFDKRFYFRFRADGGQMHLIWDSYYGPGMKTLDDVARDILSKKSSSRHGASISVYDIKPRTGFFESPVEDDITEKFVPKKTTLLVGEDLYSFFEYVNA
jgi:hypothetical protein